MRRAVLALFTFAALAVAPVASATTADENALAQRFAPVVRIVQHRGECGAVDTYLPIDVSLLFNEPTVALRGPWGSTDLVKVGPSLEDVSKGLFDYHLDFPGNALAPGCDYLHWQQRLIGTSKPVVYAHVATEPGRPGKLSLQYWMYYVFNDWNNLHEGDWEMAQIVFDASTAAQALATKPTEIGYSQHEGAERAAWGDSKLELVDGTHPVVHPADGSHANFYDEALYLGASASEGVGCDDTRGPTSDIRPLVQTIPSDPAQAKAAFPWITFEGRWGELRPAFFNGPTGPNLKSQWAEPIRWSEGWRARSYTVPAASAFGPGATGFFCGAIGHGSLALVRLLHHPLGFGLLLAGLVAIILFALSRATWRPAAPLRLACRRTWGQILTAAARMYVARPGLFIAIGLALLPISLVITLLQVLVLHASNVLGVQTGDASGGLMGLIALAVGTALTLLGLGLVQAATAQALVELDQGRSVGPVRAYRLASGAIRPLVGALAIATLVVSFLASSGFALPIGIWLAGCWALIVPVIELERRSAFGSLRRSGRLVRRSWLKVSSLIVAGGAIVLAVGPVIGVLLILGTNVPFWLINVIAGVVYSVMMPFVALTTAYAYFDARVKDELVGEGDPSQMPAEVELFA
jgi:hypothetical protein